MKKKVVSVVAISCMGFAAALNVSEVFSNAIFKVPGIGDIAKNITIREIRKANEPVNIKVKNYELVEVSEELELKVRKHISTKIDELCNATMEEYKVIKKEFLSLGNREKDYKKAEVVFKVDLKLVREEAISFIISKYDDQKIGDVERYTYNINLENDSDITLKDIFGPEYKELVKNGVDKYIMSKSVKYKDIADYYELHYKTKNVEYSMETPFYINSNGNPVLIFDSREIAPSKYGKQDVEIEK